MWRTFALTSALWIGLSAAGCGGAAVPTQARTEAIGAIRAAREAGAADEPRAVYHLELAEAELGRAERQIGRGEMDRAERTLQRARLDAELAVALTREASVEAEARELHTRIENMRASAR